MTEPARIAANLIAALDARRQIACPSAGTDFDLDAAARVATEVRALRESRGERPVGRKIGFTNRTIWEEYGVYAPIWGTVYDTTLRPEGEPLDLSPFLEPRIEPEIILRLGRAPQAGMSGAELMACVSHVSLGFEIVQSLFEGWRFSAADTVAAFALHAALVPGPFVEVAPGEASAWQQALAAFDVVLMRGGEVADRGNSENVLGGGPLAALSHLLDVLASDPGAPPLAAGEIVATGTLTRALPIGPGETWSARADGVRLPPIRLSLRGEAGPAG